MTTTWSGPDLAGQPVGPTPAQQNAIAVVRSVYRTQANVLARLYREWLDTPPLKRGSFLKRTNPLQQTLIATFRDAYHTLHRAYGGMAPTDVTVPLIAAYYGDLGAIPDAGELAELEHRGKRGVNA